MQQFSKVFRRAKLLYFDVVLSSKQPSITSVNTKEVFLSSFTPKTQKSKPFVVNRSYGLDDSGINALETKRTIKKT